MGQRQSNDGGLTKAERAEIVKLAQQTQHALLAELQGNKTLSPSAIHESLVRIDQLDDLISNQDFHSRVDI